MKHKSNLLATAGLICLLLFSYTEGNAKEKAAPWIFYGETKEGKFYYERQSVQKIAGKITRVWDMLTFKKDKDIPIGNKYRQNFGNQVSLHEFYCADKKRKLIRYVLYNVEGKVTENYQNQSPKLHPIAPGSIYEALQKEVCK